MCMCMCVCACVCVCMDVYMCVFVYCFSLVVRLKHRCYQWELEKVRRIEPWEISQTEHDVCMEEFASKSGMQICLRKLAELTGFDPLKAAAESPEKNIRQEMIDFGQELWGSFKPIKLTDKGPAQIYVDFNDDESFWDTLIESNINPLHSASSQAVLPRKLVVMMPDFSGPQFDFMLSAAAEQHISRYSYVPFYSAEGKSSDGLYSESWPKGKDGKVTPECVKPAKLKKGQTERAEDMKLRKEYHKIANIAAIIRIFFGCLRYGQRDMRGLAQHNLMYPQTLSLVLGACASVHYGLTVQEHMQTFALPFKILALVEEIIHLPAYSATQALRQLELCDVVMKAVSGMMQGALYLLQEVELTSSDASHKHPSLHCKANGYNPFRTSLFSSPLASLSPEIAKGEAASFQGQSICTCMMCALRQMVSVALQISQVVQNLNFFEYTSENDVAWEKHLHVGDLDTRLLGNILCRRRAMRAILKPTFLRCLMDVLKYDLVMSGGLYALSRDDPVLAYHASKLADTGLDHDTKDDEEEDENKDARQEPKVPFVVTTSSALRLRSDAAAIWAEYLKVYPDKKFQQFLEYSYALCGPEGDRVLGLRISLMDQLLNEIRRLPVATRLWFERAKVREMQHAMLAREKYVNSLIKAHDEAHQGEEEPPQFDMTEEEEDELEGKYPIPAEENILAVAFVQQYDQGGMGFFATGRPVRKLLICTNYYYYVSKGEYDPMIHDADGHLAKFTDCGYSHAKLMEAFAARIPVRQQVEQDLLQHVGQIDEGTYRHTTHENGMCWDGVGW
jgi:hypothetical protein